MNHLKNSGQYQIFAVLIFLGFLVGCHSNTGTNPQNEDAKFSLSMSTAEFPENVDHITGEISRSGYESVSEFFLISGDSAIADFGSVTAGVWHISVTAYDDTDQELYAGETDVNIVAGQTNTVHLVLNPVTGSLNVVVHWGEPADYSGEFIYMYLSNTTNTSRIYRYNLQSDMLEQVVYDQRAAYPFLIPSLNRIGFVGLGDIYSINPDGSGQSHLFSWPVIMVHTDYSPVTEKIYFYEITSSGRQLASIDLNGENLYYFDHPENSNNTGPAPSALNTSMLFASDRGGVYNIYLMDLGTEEVTQLTTSDNKSISPVWSPDETGFYYLEENGDGYRAIRHYSFNTQSDELIYSNNDIIITQIDVSPDGDKLAFTGGEIVSPGSTRHLYLYDLTTSSMVQVTSVDLALATPLWLSFD